ncbi:MAG TPA: L-seryl-tRNA(Sec) selenium transferase [Desulfomicrobiaceae bacterium]|nr:L-seryl-tRNA(Sec) selenium transferase [Desulfomicrobiaceae bacterium]
MSNLFRLLPSVDSLLRDFSARDDLAGLPHDLQRDLIVEFLDLCREEIRSGVLQNPEQLQPENVFSRGAVYVRTRSRPHFRRVLNGTGVVVHTNLGRSILAPEAVKAVTEGCLRYSNLELALETGKRGSRYSHVEELLCRLTGAEAGLVVNNNAAAVLLILDTLAKGREVIVARGQLVEIGGAFRIPEVMAKSGAVLREVGATNRVHVHDYEGAVTDRTAAIMKVHTSNYRIVGFHKEVPLSDLVRIGRTHEVPVIEDLGSGNLCDFSGLGLTPEPTVQKVVESGVDVVCFSGDKLLGGPQAGIIVGRKETVERIKRNQLNRALRIDKMTLAALEATLRLYLDPATVTQAVPTLRMITASSSFLKKKAERLRDVLEEVLPETVGLDLAAGQSRVGGGAFPEQDLPTTLVRIHPGAGVSAEKLRVALLDTNPPLIGRIESDLFCLDPRTIEEDEFVLVGEVIGEALRFE